MQIEIVQGQATEFAHAGVNVVIDVIRAFTVAQVAFLGGAQEIVLAGDAEQAFALRKVMPDALLAGEIGGLAISGFDLDNSPVRMAQADVAGRRLIQMTTNGVKAAVRALAAEYTLVTGFSNAARTAHYIRARIPALRNPLIRLIATHPTSDDDVACAEYIQDILLGEDQPDAATVARRIRASAVAQKFFDPQQPDFDEQDIEWCAREIESPFVMRIKVLQGIPIVERVDV